MKKIFGLLTALLVAAACMAFTSCATDHPSAEFGSSPLTAIQGDMGTLDPVSNSAGTVVFTVAYSDSMSAWGGGNGVLNFKGHSNSTKDDYKYGGDAVSIASLPAGVSKATADNVQLVGLVNGKTYTFSFFTVPTLSLTVTEN
jgi:hypothetical protein